MTCSMWFLMLFGNKQIWFNVSTFGWWFLQHIPGHSACVCTSCRQKNYPRPVASPAGTAHSVERTESPEKDRRNNEVLPLLPTKKKKKNSFKDFFFVVVYFKVQLCTFSIELRWTVAEPGRSTFTWASRTSAITTFLLNKIEGATKE